MFLGPILTLLIPAATGIGLFAWRNLAREKILLTTLGASFGLIAFTTVAYLVQLVAPLSPLLASLLLTATAIAAYVAWSARTGQGRRTTWRSFVRLPTDKGALVVFILTFILTSFIAPKLLFLDPEGGISIGVLNAYGDAPWHMANITAFAEGQSTPPENPILADTRLTYPFLVNLLSAIMLASGGTYTEVVTLPALLLIPLIFTLLYCFTREVTGKKTAAALVVILFLLAGGTLGWLRFGEDLTQSNLSLVEFVLHLPARDYTGAGGDADGFFFLNPILSLLLPQRSFLLAFPAALTILLLVLPASASSRHRTSDLNRPTDSPSPSYISFEPYFWAGLLAGFTPLIHGHTILALLPALVGVALISRIWERAGFKTQLVAWLVFAGTALAVGLPEVLYYTRGIGESESFLRFDPGWMAGDTNWLWFWLKNTGLLFVAALGGFFFPAPNTAKALAAAGLVLFAASNLFLFAPWPWDNFKLLIYALLFSLPLIAWTLHWLFFHKKAAWLKAIGIAFIFIHGLSASLDLWKLALPTAPTWTEWDKPALEAARLIRRHTSPHATIVAAPIHNSPVALTGRFMYLGFPGHVWSHGGTPWVREAALKQFFAGEITQLPEAPADFVLIGPAEKATYPNLVIQPTWQQVAASDQYQLYALKELPDATN